MHTAFNQPGEEESPALFFENSKACFSILQSEGYDCTRTRHHCQKNEDKCCGSVDNDGDGSFKDEDEKYKSCEIHYRNKYLEGSFVCVLSAIKLLAAGYAFTALLYTML